MEQFRNQFEHDPKPPCLIQRLAREFITALLPAVLIALFVNVFIAQAAMVEDGPSMQPNLYVGYRMMTEKVSYRFHEPQRGDIVIAKPGDSQVTLVKRVIGLPGETIESKDGHTYINGKPINEPWITNFGGSYLAPTRIPEGHVFIIGDNRPISHDSRAIGSVSIEDIEGRVIFVYWPLTEIAFFP
ncbi:MAG: signal peptidase I [Anaerolineales bacterium]